MDKLYLQFMKYCKPVFRSEMITFFKFVLYKILFFTERLNAWTIMIAYLTAVVTVHSIQTED